MYVVHGFGFYVHATCILNSHGNDKNILQMIYFADNGGRKLAK